MGANDLRSRTGAQPLRMRLLLLAASGLLPLLIVMVWGLNYLVDDRREEAEQSVLELSRALATAVDAELRSVVSLLEHVGTSDELERADFRSFYLSARRTAEQLGWRQVILFDGDGRMLLRSSEPYGTAGMVVFDPESLARAVRTQRPVVGNVVDTKNLPTGAFAVRVPVLREGKLVYVLSAVLPTDMMLKVLKRQEIPSGSVASIFDQTQHRVARSRPAGSVVPSASLQEMLKQGASQGVGRTRTHDGVDSYTGYTRLQDSGWVVAVGTSVADVNEGLHALLRALSLGLAGSLALSVLLAWVLSRRVATPIEALKEGAAALGRGGPVQLPALAIEELDEVAMALTAAAADRDRATARLNEALRAAEEANRSKDQFLAMLGHELRNPLAPITTAIQLMALKGDDKTQHERRIIERQLVHVTRLVDDLLDVSRITSGRLAINREPVRLAAVVSQVVELLQPSVYQRTLSLEMAPGLEDAWVAGDEVRLVQVFNNLLVNAIKFTPAGAAIRVRAAAGDGEARVEIEDTGVGIASEDLDRVFDLFYQAPQSADRARGGLGLGLPIVRSLVEMHGGSVHAASAGSGQGTCITVRLPLCEPPAAAPDSAPEPEREGAGMVLVVDDNEDAADTCATLLEMSGYTVRTAYTPESALEVLRDFTPDVAILDIGLPGMSGYALAARMKSPPYDYGGRLVALTGYGQAADMAASKHAGFDAHVTKPVGPSQLLELVDRMALNSSADTPS